MAINCNVPALQAASKCYLDQCNSEAEREAIEIYFRVLGLAGLGGASYTPATLQAAAKTWQALSMKDLAAINVYITSQNAVENGASLPSTINSIKAAAKCYMCIPEATRKQLLMFLRCAISNLTAPD